MSEIETVVKHYATMEKIAIAIVSFARILIGNNVLYSL